MSQDPLLGMDAMIADAIGYAIPVNSKMGKLIRESGVVRSSEFRRIAALPRRDWEKDPQLEELRILLTQHLRRPGGTMELKPNQAAALRDIVDHGGLFGPQAVGVGKTLITLLAPVVLRAQRPLLLVPASVRDQTLRKVLPQMRKHWRLHPMLRVESYTAVSLEKNAKMLDTYQPDLILADECHNLSGATSGRTKRIRRYMNAHPETKFLAVSGTVTNRSILAYAEILYWCLKNASPLPTNWRELQDWARALDEDVPDDKRMPPGALALFCEQGETVRHGFRRRLSETPGIVATRDGELGTSLRIHRREINAPPHIHAMIAKLRRDWETPNGDAIVEAVEVWRHARELALGMWYRWDPPPPRDWFDARRAWNQHVREVLKHNKRGLDTPLQVWMECAQNPVPLKAFTDWRDVKDTFEPNTVAVWESEYLLQDAARWLRDTENGGGIAWVEHIVFGERLAQVAGVPYFGGGEKASHDILDATGPCVASIAAHSTGKNLVQWSRNLVTCPPTSGKMWEQMLGRTHRQGQTADEVEAWVYQHTDEFRAALAQAVRDARYLKETLGGAQRLLYCDTTFDIDET